MQQIKDMDAIKLEHATQTPLVLEWLTSNQAKVYNQLVSQLMATSYGDPINKMEQLSKLVM